MAKYRHLQVSQPGIALGYITTDGGGGDKVYRYPARNVSSHAEKLRQDLIAAREAVAELQPGLTIDGLVLEFVGAVGAGIESDSLDDRRAKMELLSTREENGVTYATVFVPEEGIPRFLKKIEQYETKLTKKGEPQHKPLMESLEGVRLPVLRSFWTDDPTRFPADPKANVWWEVWLRRSAATATTSADGLIPHAFRTAAQAAGLRIIPGISVFPERVVFLMHGSAEQWASSLSLLLPLAELRQASEVPVEYVTLRPVDARMWIDAAVARIQPPPLDAPAVCMVDTGCNRAHPLLEPVVAPDDIHVWHPEWSPIDNVGHGTEMAGIAVYGAELADLLSGSGPIPLSHRIEAVKFIDGSSEHGPENYGYVTVEAVARAEAHRPDRSRVVCLMTTSANQPGDEPRLWSAELDKHTSGQLDDVQRLYVVSVGNIRGYLTEPYAYPQCNHFVYGIEDPAQAYNVLSVGGYTERVVLSETHSGRECLAPRGGLSPLSRTSILWDRQKEDASQTEWSEWPYKPDVVMEAGNYLRDAEGRPEACDDLHLLTTCVTPTGKLLTTAGDTSAAAAQAAKLAAELMAEYPMLWPETIRALIVHSAEWTPQMKAEFPGPGREAIRRRLRCYGYGVPNVDRARYTLNNHVSLIVQDSLQPFKKQGSGIKTNEYNLHVLPWPKEVLEQIFMEQVTVKVTLSYFIEPNPAKRGITSKFHYASHGLRFKLRGPDESDEAFAKRISKDTWTDEERKRKDERTVARPTAREPQQWHIGSDVRTRGSIHCDWWSASAAEVAKCGAIAVYPVTGWWKTRKQLRCYTKRARYALIVTLSTSNESVDLYTPIAQQISTVLPVTM